MILLKKHPAQPGSFNNTLGRGLRATSPYSFVRPFQLDGSLLPCMTARTLKSVRPIT
jgi:hypothetical protein